MTNERGFILLSVVFLTLITSFMAVMVLNANLKLQQRNSNLRLTAIYLAEEQFAEIESLAANGSLEGGNHVFYGDNDDLTVGDKEFSVSTTVSGDTQLKTVRVIVKWNVDGKDFDVDFEKAVRVR